MLSRWFGKIFGAICGYVIAGPVGALLGLIIGNVFDKGVVPTLPGGKAQREQQARVQAVFFETTFMVMGHVAKADGRVTENEIRVAKQIMQQMQLNPSQRREAIRYFTQGKHTNFNLNDALAKLMLYCSNQRNLLRMFIEIQYKAASADVTIGTRKRQILYVICQRLGFAPIFTQYQQESYTYSSSQHQSQQGQQNRQQNRQQYQNPYRPTGLTLKQAYAILEVSESATKAEVKRAYRKQVSRHHPDKLIAQGLPAQMIKIATEKTQQIHSAYEQIKKARAF